MRPRLLTLNNFMPFRSLDGYVHQVDFSNLELFAITGPMASGKSSLIDAIAWCLYGRTARYGNDSRGVISAGENSCEVSLDFTIGTRWFRAVRRTGKTTESGLSEREGEEWVQDTSGAESLTKRIEALLGLDFASFTKTVILPQGTYAEFLLSEPSKRRDLLAKILELGVYARVAERAKGVAVQAKTRAETLRETLSQYAGVNREQIAQRRAEWHRLGEDIATTTAQEETLRRLVHKAEGVAATQTRIAELHAEERQRAEEKERARQKHEAAETWVATLEQDLAQTLTAQDTLGYDAGYHEVMKRVVAHLRDHREAWQEAEQKSQALARVQQEVQTLTRQIADQEHRVATAQHAHHVRAAALQQEVAARGDIALLTEKLGEAQRWKTLQQEQVHLTEQHNTCTQQLTSVRQLLTSLVQQETAKEQELRDLVHQREQTRNEEHERGRLELEADHLGKELQDAVREEKRVRQEVEQAQSALQLAEQEAQQRQAAVAQAEQQEHAAMSALEAERHRHEVAHLRTLLQVGDPCPVCCAPVRELPAATAEGPNDLSALQRAVDTVKVTLTRARQSLQDASAAVAAAGTRREAAVRELVEREQQRRAAQDRFVTRFPGFSSLTAALNALRAQRQELNTALRDLEERAQTVEKEKLALARQRETVQRQEATLTETVRGIATNLERNAAQLTTLAHSLASYLAAGEDPEAILLAQRQALIQAQEDVKALEQTLRQEEEVLGSLRTRKLQKEGDLGRLAAQQEAAVAQAEREAQVVRESLHLPADAALPEPSTLEGELVELERKQEQHAHLRQREDALREEREKAERRVVESRAELQACERFLHDTRQQRSQAEHDLDAIRAELQAEIVQSGLSGVGTDGQGLQERLATVHERVIALRERYSRLATEIDEQERRCAEKEKEEERLQAAETEGRLATDLHKLLGAEFTDFLSQGAVEALMRDATVHLQRLTHGRYSFDIAYKRRAIDLQIVDHEDHRRVRPTHSLSGGETFLASLAIALALAQSFREVASGKAAKTSTECLILDEGFGTLDREGLQLVTETLQELRGEEGRMVGIITHVEEVAAAMPMRIEVRKGGRSSTITVSG